MWKTSQLDGGVDIVSKGAMAPYALDADKGRSWPDSSSEEDRFGA